MTASRQVPALALVGLLATAGVTHLLVPRFYDAIVPRALPFSDRSWTVASGIAELGCALAVALPRTRRVGGFVTAGLFVLVFPANIQMAVDWWDRSTAMRAVSLARLPLQIPLVWWAITVGRTAPRNLPT